MKAEKILDPSPVAFFGGGGEIHGPAPSPDLLLKLHGDGLARMTISRTERIGKNAVSAVRIKLELIAGEVSCG